MASGKKMASRTNQLFIFAAGRESLEKIAKINKRIEYTARYYNIKRNIFTYKVRRQQAPLSPPDAITHIPSIQCNSFLPFSSRWAVLDFLLRNNNIHNLELEKEKEKTRILLFGRTTCRLQFHLAAWKISSKFKKKKKK